MYVNIILYTPATNRLQQARCFSECTMFTAFAGNSFTKVDSQHTRVLGTYMFVSHLLQVNSFVSYTLGLTRLYRLTTCIVSLKKKKTGKVFPLKFREENVFIRLNADNPRLKLSPDGLRRRTALREKSI